MNDNIYEPSIVLYSTSDRMVKENCTTLMNRSIAIGAANAHRMALIINMAPTAVLSSKIIAPFQNPLDNDKKKTVE